MLNSAGEWQGPGASTIVDRYDPRPSFHDARTRWPLPVPYQDGLAVVETDLKLRGFADLSASSEKKTRADETLVVGRPIRLALSEEFMVGSLSAPHAGHRGSRRCL